jgi:hypothetical protein
MLVRPSCLHRRRGCGGKAALIFGGGAWDDKSLAWRAVDAHAKNVEA